MATFYSRTRRGSKLKFAAAIFLFAAAGIVFADDAQNKIFATRAETEFHRAQIRFQSNPENFTNAWQLARTSYDFADFATNGAQRAAIANQGITACRQSLAHDSNSAPVHYYLAMNLGQLARSEFIGALRLVREMEREFKTAAALDAHFDFAGPERNLGLLYRDAPGWPMSIGSKRKSRSFLEQAVKLAPNYPENLLNLAESYLKWSERDAAKKELDALDSLWPKAQTNYTGEIWERSWDDWSTRRDAARKKLREISAPVKPLKNGR
jgi:tetratricopeptide (TPR) repeat protein